MSTITTIVIRTSLMLTLAIVTLLSSLSSCADACNECLEISTKEILYVDADGTNIFFGSGAIFTLDSISILNENNEVIDVWDNEDTETLIFELGSEYNTYSIYLSDELSDEIKFELSERESTSCCGNVTISTSTILNNLEIENNDLIVITR